MDLASLNPIRYLPHTVLNPSTLYSVGLHFSSLNLWAPFKFQRFSSLHYLIGIFAKAFRNGFGWSGVLSWLLHCFQIAALCEPRQPSWSAFVKQSFSHWLFHVGWLTYRPRFAIILRGEGLNEKQKMTKMMGWMTWAERTFASHCVEKKVVCVVLLFMKVNSYTWGTDVAGWIFLLPINSDFMFGFHCSVSMCHPANQKICTIWKLKIDVCCSLPSSLQEEKTSTGGRTAGLCWLLVCAGLKRLPWENWLPLH